MNGIPKYVASTTLRDITGNAKVIVGDVPASVAKLKRRSRGNIVTYGNGPLDASPMGHDLIDEFRRPMTPVAVGRGRHMFEAIDATPGLNLDDVTQFGSGVVLLDYPRGDSAAVLPARGASVRKRACHLRAVASAV